MWTGSAAHGCDFSVDYAVIGVRLPGMALVTTLVTNPKLVTNT